MNHDPFTLFCIDLTIFLPRILFDILLTIFYRHNVWSFKALCHCLKFIEKCFLTCIFNQVNCRNCFISSMIQLSELHRNLCWEPALNTKTQKNNVSSLTTFKFRHLICQFRYTINCVITIRNENDCYWCTFINIYKLFF